jgi:Disintegrin
MLSQLWDQLQRASKLPHIAYIRGAEKGLLPVRRRKCLHVSFTCEVVFSLIIFDDNRYFYAIYEYLVPVGCVRISFRCLLADGIAEPGEDCDPGFGRNSTCCDSMTCKLAANAICDPESSDCCTSDCQFAPNTQVCRPIVDAACDQSEKCSGTDSGSPYKAEWSTMWTWFGVCDWCLYISRS